MRRLPAACATLDAGLDVLRHSFSWERGRFSGSLRHLDAGLELESLFFTRIERTVRKDGTVRIDGILYEADLSLRSLEVQLRFDPYRMARIEVYCRGKACGLARLVDLQLNSQLDGSQHYDR